MAWIMEAYITPPTHMNQTHIDQITVAVLSFIRKSISYNIITDLQLGFLSGKPPEILMAIQILFADSSNLAHRSLET